MKKCLFNLLFFVIYAQSGIFVPPPKVLAVYDGKAYKSYENTPCHRNLEFTFNYLGFRLEYLDISGKIPEPVEPGEYAAVFSWFNSDEISNAEEYAIFLNGCLKKGTRIIIWGSPGLSADRKTGKKIPEVLVRNIFSGMGIRYDGDYYKDPLRNRILYEDTAFFNFEKPLKAPAVEILKARNIDPLNKVRLKLMVKGVSRSKSDACITGRKGSIALGDFLMEQKAYPGAENDITIYGFTINPFTFFNEALGKNNKPAMDFCIRNGKRIFYSHIDGDGFSSLSITSPGKLCGEVILEEALKKNPLPVSASFITAMIDPRYKGSNTRIEVFKKIASLPNIEIATHTFSHPFVWSNEQKKQAAKVYEHYNIPIPGYPEVDMEKEIAGSAAFLDSLATPYKKTCPIIFWSGNCRPESDALYHADKAGLLNMNGGTARYDRKFNSVAHLSPLIRQVGKWRQIYTSNSNDAIYTNVWKGPYNGFQQVIETFENTGSPAVIRPVNVYYHFYSGEKFSSLNALKKIYRHCLENEDLSPMFASDYSALVNGFMSSRIHRGDNGWVIEDYGNCLTVRFDDWKGIPDEAASKNITGFRIFKGSLYVFLKKAGKAVIRFIPAEKEKGIVLSRTSAEILSYSKNKGAVKTVFRNWNDASFIFRNKGGVKLKASYAGIPAKVQTLEDGLIMTKPSNPITAGSEVELIVEPE
ncbi:MAG: polysaccharide deacetylase family protein [Fibrobacterota bacterium]